ncbi:MAG: cytochrome c biogenesis protein CcdA [Bacteroidota bacterium]
MMRLTIWLLFAAATTNTYAQVRTPVKWNFSADAISETEAHLTFTATLDSGWHIYSQFLGEDGPLPTTFTFVPSKKYKPVKKVEELSKPVKSYDKTFMMDIVWFEKVAVFRQKVKLQAPSATIEGKIEFMVCTDEMCLPPDEVSFQLEAKAKSPKRKQSKQDEMGSNDSAPSRLLSPCDSTSYAFVANDSVIVREANTDSVNKPDSATEDSLLGVFIAGLTGGLLALFMPCIFPLIPFTISYFTKQNKDRAWKQVMFYGLSIIVLYVSLGLVISVVFGSDALNDLSTGGVFNILFFLLLSAFAASLLGGFEIMLPHSWVNGADSKADRGGLMGIFFMAATLALVSFSCTAPIVGTLLVEAATMNNYVAPAIGMLGFSVALALPFMLFAFFPSWLHALPKSGGWLNSMKVVLGFLELALALKFLSNVDLAYHWGWLDREVFLVLWIIIFGLLGFYLLGKIKLPHDTETGHTSSPRLFLSIATLAFTLYMIPGLWGAPLKAISAFLPPIQTQDFDLYDKSFADQEPTNGVKKKNGDLFQAPYKLNGFFDYDEGLAYAKAMNKPVIIDFTGHACVNCRKMENVVWSDPRILNRLQHDYVLIQLYVDDKTELPENEQTISDYSGKKIKTIGNKWSDFQSSVFGTNSQPWYVLLDGDGKLLVSPRGADYRVENFKEFLDKGLMEFYNNKKG